MNNIDKDRKIYSDRIDLFANIFKFMDVSILRTIPFSRDHFISPSLKDPVY